MFKQIIVFPKYYRKIINCYSKDNGLYGVTLSGLLPSLHASGRGWVRSMGYSPLCHYFLGVVYEDIITFDGCYIGDVLIRYCNMRKIYVKRNQRVYSNTILGQIHLNETQQQYLLYLEADKDIRFPNYSPLLTVVSGDLKVGFRGENDTTFDPLLIFH